MTANQIVGETYTLLRVTCGHTAAVAFLDRLDESRRVERVFVSKELEGRAYRLLRQYADQDFDGVCCDTACSDALTRCNLPGEVATCASVAAKAPTLTPWGLLVGFTLLGGLGVLALRRRRQA